MRESASDTVIVRTRGPIDPGAADGVLHPEVTIGSVDGPDETMFGQVSMLAMRDTGSVYVFDGQVPALRLFDGRRGFVNTIGREGSGPGEYRMAMGLDVTPDGRIALYDLGNARINFYSPDGEPGGEWRVQVGMAPLVLRAHVAQALTIDTAGRAWIKAILHPPSEDSDWVLGALLYSGTGAFVDSVLPPERRHERHVLTADGPRGRSTLTPAYAPSLAWTVTRDGGIASGLTTEYRIDVTRADGSTLRIVKDSPPVPIDDEERAQRMAEATATLRRADPGWNWNAAPPPRIKPFFRSLQAAHDGRLWVKLHVPGSRGEQPPPANAPAGTPARITWSEPEVYDVFDADGNYLGRIPVPDRTSLLVMEGGRAWGITRDSSDVQFLRRFHIAFPGASRR